MGWVIWAPRHLGILRSKKCQPHSFLSVDVSKMELRLGQFKTISSFMAVKSSSKKLIMQIVYYRILNLIALLGGHKKIKVNPSETISKKLGKTLKKLSKGT